MIFSHPLDLGGALGVHPPLDLVILFPSIGILHIEIREIVGDTALDTLEPEGGGLVLPLHNLPLQPDVLKIPCVIGLPTRSVVFLISTDLPPAAFPGRFVHTFVHDGVF